MPMTLDIVKMELPKKGASIRMAVISMTRTAMPASGTVLEIEFNDKSRFTLGPNTEFEVEKYFQAAGGSSGEEAFTSRVLKGAFRYVSGLIAKKKRQNVRIIVAVATIGIRGTHFEGEVT